MSNEYAQERLLKTLRLDRANIATTGLMLPAAPFFSLVASGHEGSSATFAVSAYTNDIESLAWQVFGTDVLTWLGGIED